MCFTPSLTLPPNPPPLTPTSVHATGEETYSDRVIVRNVKAEDASKEDHLKALFGPGIVKMKYERRLLRIKFESPEGASAAVAKTGASPFGEPLTVELELLPSARKARAIASGVERKPNAGRAPRNAPAAAAGPPAVAGLVVLVRQMAANTTVDAVKSFFAFAGPIANIVLTAGGTTASISYLTPEAANKALTKEGAELLGARLNVEIKKKVGGSPRAAKAANAEAGAQAGRKRTVADNDEVDTTNSIWVGMIPETADEVSVSAIFAHIGAIKKVSVKGRSKKFANGEI